MQRFESEDDDAGHGTARRSGERFDRSDDQDDELNGTDEVEVSALDDVEYYGEPQHESPRSFRHRYCYGEPQHEPDLGREFRFSCVDAALRKARSRRRRRKHRNVGRYPPIGN